MRLTNLLVILAIASLAALLAACGVTATPTPGPSPDTTPTPTETPTPSPTPTGAIPSDDLSWLNDLVIKFESEPVANPPIAIKEYMYNGKTVYFVPQRCCDIMSDLYDAQGNLVAHPDGGVGGNGDGRASDFLSTAAFVHDVWTDPRGEQNYTRELVKAPIQSIDITVLKSVPPQYRLDVVSGLPNGCALFDHYTVNLDDATKTFTVEVFNSAPAAGSDIMCSMIYGMATHHIMLTGVQPGATYTVNVNDKTTTFDAQ